MGREGSYEVSSWGRVRTMKPGRRGQILSVRRILSRSGRLKALKVRLSSPTVAPTVHSLVLTAFVGPRPEGKEGAHDDGDPANNYWRNLGWKTHAENMADAIRHATMPRGSTSGRAILSEDQVRQIRVLLRAEKSEAIALRFGVSGASIRQIARGQTWKHVDAGEPVP